MPYFDKIQIFFQLFFKTIFVVYLRAITHLNRVFYFAENNGENMGILTMPKSDHNIRFSRNSQFFAENWSKALPTM
jgi:hypothetical protein